MIIIMIIIIIIIIIIMIIIINECLGLSGVSCHILLL